MLALQRNPDAIIFAVAGAISAILTVFAWHRRSSPRAPFFAAMMAGETAWALGEALELVTVDLRLKLLFLDLRVLGAVTAAIGLLTFVLHYTGRTEWLNRRWLVAICAPALAMVLAAWTNPWHYRYWTWTELREVDGLQLLFRGYGPIFWTTYVYCVGTAVWSSVLLAFTVVRSGGMYRAQSAIMLFGATAPWIVSIIDMSQVFGYIYVDATAATFAFTGLAFLPGLVHLRLLELTPVAWAAVVERMNDPVFVFDHGCRIIVLNSAAEHLLHRPVHEVLGVQAAKAFEGWPALSEQLSWLGEKNDVTFEIDGPGPDRAAVYNASVSRLSEGEHVGSTGLVLVLRDITELKRAERERIRMLSEQKARAEAEAANHAKDKFLATLSHELRTPLTPVLATVTAMLDDSATPATLRPVLEMIRRNIDLEARLIDDLLDLTRIKRGELLLKREIIDAHEQVDRVIEICGDDVHNADLKLVSQLKAESHYIDADPTRFQQALWNLLKNAIKFSTTGGTVTIRSRNRVDRDEMQTSTWLVIDVIDEGIGIEAELLHRLFNLFEQGSPTTGRKFGGLGLGLTISRSVVEHHGGRVVGASEGTGRGATFSIELPAVPAPVPRTVAPCPPALVTRNPLKILLVEDNKDTLNYISAMLIRRGHDVRTASNLASGLQAVEETEFELLISDIELPDGSGLDLMWKLRSRAGVMGIALSGFGSAQDIEQSCSAGFAEHLTKPVDFKRLEEAIGRLAENTSSSNLVQT
jgi:signal transduction histidine kinase/ActR/RegA family two-component response regulator